MKVLRITALRAGFRRAGLAHPAEPVDHPVEQLSPVQIEQLLAEPNLVVEELDLPDGPAAPPAPEPSPPQPVPSDAGEAGDGEAAVETPAAEKAADDDGKKANKGGGRKSARGK